MHRSRSVSVVSGLATCALIGGVVVLPQMAGASTSSTAVAPSVLSAKKVKAGQMVVRVTGDMLGSSPQVQVRGVKGKAKGTNKTTTKTATLKKLKPGTYQVTAAPISVGGRTSLPTITPRKVTLTKKRGANVSVAFTASAAPTPSVSPSVSASPSVSPSVTPSSSPSVSTPPTAPPLPAGTLVTVSPKVFPFSAVVPWFSPDGTRIAYGTDYGQSPPETVVVKSLITNDVQRVSADGTNSGLAWSPDGTQIAHKSNSSPYMVEQLPFRGGLHVTTLATGSVVAIDGPRDVQGVSSTGRDFGWSPDGTQMVFTSSSANILPGDVVTGISVYVKNLSSGVVRRVSTAQDGAVQADARAKYPQWSPDGSKVSFYSDANNLVPGDPNGTGEDLFIKTLSDGSVSRVSTGPAGNEPNGRTDVPVLSPDWTKIAFRSDATNLVPGVTQPSVYVKNLVNGEVQALPNVPGDAWWLRWSPDGSRIAFVTSVNIDPDDKDANPSFPVVTPDIYVTEISTGQVSWLSCGIDGATRAAAQASAFSWSPDSKRVVFEGLSPTGTYMKVLPQ
jgi:Tol biopolymer transport system component